MAHYYKPSGKFSPKSFILFLVIALIAFPLLGLIYSYCIWYIPFIYINMFIAAGFGFGVGFAVTFGVIGKGKVRNVLLAAIFALLGGLIAMYFHWAVWIDLVVNAGESYGNDRIGVTASNIKILQVFQLASDPATLFSLIGEVNEFGTWGIRSATVSGIPLTIIWIIELGIVTVIPILMALGKVGQPFCEMENEWFEEMNLPAFEFIDDPESLVRNLENGNEDIIKDLKKAKSLDHDHSTVILFGSNSKEYFISIENQRQKVSKKNEIEFDSIDVVKYIAITEGMKELLIERGNSESAVETDSTDEENENSKTE